jgi:competence protein ComFC
LVWRKVLSLITNSVSSALIPEVCLFCGSGNLEGSTSICPECRTSLRWVLSPICSVCGRPLSTFEKERLDLCGACISNPPVYDMARYGLYYENLVRVAITRFKFNASLYSSRPLADLLIETFNRHYIKQNFDVILPVPVHTRRLMARGFNQVTILSQKLATATGIPLDRTNLVKTKNTDPQVRLSRAKRLLNLTNAFQINNKKTIVKKRVLIVDDVSTTGATINEVSKVVRKAGANYVGVIILAFRTHDGAIKAKEDDMEAL